MGVYGYLGDVVLIWFDRLFRNGDGVVKIVEWHRLSKIHLFVSSKSRE